MDHKFCPGDCDGDAWTVKVRHTPILPTLAQLERELILRSLDLHDGNIKLAGPAIGLSWRTLYRRMHEYGMFDAQK